MLHLAAAGSTCWNSCDTTDWKRSTTRGLGGGGPWLQVICGCLFMLIRSILQESMTRTSHVVIKSAVATAAKFTLFSQGCPTSAAALSACCTTINASELA
jgi:hypothetical protein